MVGLKRSLPPAIFARDPPHALCLGLIATAGERHKKPDNNSRLREAPRGGLISRSAAQFAVSRATVPRDQRRPNVLDSLLRQSTPTEAEDLFPEMTVIVVNHPP